MMTSSTCADPASLEANDHGVCAVGDPQGCMHIKISGEVLFKISKVLLKNERAPRTDILEIRS